MAENNELEKNLWQAADKMHSNMDVTEYNHVLLSTFSTTGMPKSWGDFIY